MFGLYYHIPYCRSKCSYCNFYSRGRCSAVPPAYVDALLREVSRAGGRRPDTVYFGGGTPSLLAPAQAAQLIAAANPLPGAEITLEANPETVTPALLAAFRAAGVTRLSFGVQSARDDQLRRLGRTHTAEGARRAFGWARDVGFEHLCGDIMLALPHYSRAEFDETLDLIAGGGADHISAYLLKIEPDTIFGRRPPEGLPTDEEAAGFYLYAVEQLQKAGFAQYEISNFSRPGCEGRHNLIYWNCGDYLGLGPAAHSCMGGKRFFWPEGTDAFIAGDVHPVADGDCDGEDFILMQLRLCSGLNLKKLRRDYGRSFDERQMNFIAQCVKAGYARFDGETLALTPAGLIVQNSILAELI